MIQSLTLDQVRTSAPSVFANNPFPGVSNRYAFIPTANIVEEMLRENWMVRQATESFVRSADKKGYQKHMIRFARKDDVDRVNLLITRVNHVVNREKPLAEFPEIVLTNSHDGTSTYQLHAGVFRLVCANGLVVSAGTFGMIRVRHTGDPRGIVEASYEILEETPRLMGQVEAMKQVMLTKVEENQFAVGAAIARFGFGKLEDSPINPERLLDRRRGEDVPANLWNTFNVVQENLMKGGVRMQPDPDAKRVMRTRQIKAVDASMKINKSLWQMAAEVLAAKQ